MKHRPLVLALWLLALALGAWVIARSTFTADLSAFLPSTSDPQHRVLLEQLKSGAPARTLMVGIEGGSSADRVAASRTLAGALRDSGRFEQVSNGENDAWKAVGEWVFARRYLLSPAVDDQRFTPAGLRDAIDESMSLLGTPAGNALKPLLHQDPTGETQRIAEALIPSSSPRVEDGVWVARTAERAVLLLTTRAEGADLDGQAAAIDAVRKAFEPLAAKGLRLQLTGAPLFAVDSRTQIEREVKWLSLTGTLVMSALLLVAFASPVALGVALLPVATGVVAGIAAVGLLFGNVHGVTLGFGSTLIGEAVDYAIYYLIQARAVDGQGWRRWLQGGWPTVRLGFLTSICGFAALLFSGFAGLAQLGVFSIAGLLGAVLTARFVLPVLMPNGSHGQGLRHLLARGARRSFAWLPRTRWLWLAAAVASVVFIAQRQPLWNADLSSLSPVPAEALALDASLRANISSGDAGGLVVVQGADAETVLQQAELIGQRLDALVERGVLGGYDSVARLVPSLRTQRERQAALPDAATLRTALAEATRGGPLRAERLTPFIDAVQQARQRTPDTPATALAGPLAPLVRALLQQRADGSWSALLSLQPSARSADGGIDTAAVQQALQGVPDAQVLSIGSELRRMYQRYLGEAQKQAMLGALAVVALIALALRRIRPVLAVCQPLALAVLLTMGGLAALDVPLGILHLVGLLLVVAVGSNYALFFSGAGDGTAMDDDTLASLLLANVTTVLSFTLIALSEIPALSAIGVVVAPGALLGLVLAAAFAPGRTRSL